MTRDFTASTVTQLQRMVKENHEKSYLFNIEDAINDFRQPELEIADYINDIESYQQTMFDKHDMSEKKFDQILKDVQRVDQYYGKQLALMEKKLEGYHKKVKAVSKMLQPDKLAMNHKEYFQSMHEINKQYKSLKKTLKYQSEEVQLELWLSTDYKLTEQEMEDAQSMLDEYFAPGTAAQKLRDANSAGMAGVMRNKMTDKESQKYQLMTALSNKTSTWNSLVIGVLNAIPLLDKCVDWSNDILGEAEGRTILDVSEMEHMYANSSVQHPIASGGGGILGSLALYNAAVKVANSIPQIAKLAGSWAGSLSKLPILGKINKKHLSNILGATIVDAGVYTLPQTVKDIVDKKSVGTILGNILLDSGKNLGLNIAGEGAGVLLGKVSKVASDGIRGGKNVGDLIRKSEFTNKWGILDDGTNQGVKHFSDYWEKYPERIPSLEQRLGISKGSFSNSLDGFNNFTLQAERVISEAISTGNVKNINGKSIYYIEGVTNLKKGVVVIVRDGKIQSIMPSDIKSFNKMQ